MRAALAAIAFLRLHPALAYTVYLTTAAAVVYLELGVVAAGRARRVPPAAGRPTGETKRAKPGRGGA